MIPVSGHVLDPGILRYSLNFRPRFRRSSSSGLPDPVSSRNLAFAFDARLLADKPLGFYFSLDRADGTTTGGYGTRSVFDAGGMGAGATWQNWLLPVSVHWSRRSSSSMSEVGVQQIQIARSDVTNTLRIGARNPKLQLAYDRTDFDDRLRSNDFRASNLLVDYRLRWGKGSSLASTLRWHDRTGSSAFEQFSWIEALRVQHTRTTASNLRFSRHETTGPGGTSTRQGFSLRFGSQPGRSLSLGLGGTYQSSTFEGGRQRLLTVGPDIGYRTTLPLGIAFNGRGGVDYIRRDLAGASQGYVSVFEEPHRVDETLSLLLAEPDADRTSLIVRDADGAVVYVPDLDYAVDEIGRLTEILILPGSRIEVGQTILASYRHLVFLDSDERGLVGRVGLSLGWNGIAFNHSRSHRNTEIGGEAPVPVRGDFDWSVTSLTISRILPVGAFRLDLSTRDRRDASTRYQVDEARSSLVLPSWRRFRLLIDGTAARARQEENMSRRLFAGATLRWDPRPELQLLAGVGLLAWRQEANPDEQSVTARAGLEWRIGKLEASAAWESVDRVTVRDVPIDTGWGRFSVRLSRRF